MRSINKVIGMGALAAGFAAAMSSSQFERSRAAVKILPKIDDEKTMRRKRRRRLQKQARKTMRQHSR